MFTNTVDDYSFPWFLGFINLKQAEHNFIRMMYEGVKRYDIGFYCTSGYVSGRWHLAKQVLLLENGITEIQWKTIDELLKLDEDISKRIVDEFNESESDNITGL